MNRKLKALIASLSPLAMAMPVLASSTIGIPSSQLSQFQISDIGSFIGAIVTLLFIIAGILVFVYLVWGGLQWLTSGGDSASTQKARDRITAALVGLAIIALAYALYSLIRYFFGLENAVGGTVSIPRPF